MSIVRTRIFVFFIILIDDGNLTDDDTASWKSLEDDMPEWPKTINSSTDDGKQDAAKTDEEKAEPAEPPKDVPMVTIPTDVLSQSDNEITLSPNALGTIMTNKEPKGKTELTNCSRFKL